MPCATIHLLLADRVLSEWSRAPSSAPVDVGRPGVRDAFLHGSLAPDMGFVPGVDRFISELSHYVRPAVLARTLGGAAETPLDLAFAWGWAAHVLTDIEIHPIVGRAVGERLYGDRARRVDAQEDVATHVSSEVGLDLHFLQRAPGVSRPPRSSHFDSVRIRSFVGVLREAYGIRWDPHRLLSEHRRAVRLCGYWPQALSALTLAGDAAEARRTSRVRKRLVAASVAGVSSLTGKGTAVRGFLTPMLPPRWMVAEVEEGLTRVTARVRELFRNGWDSIPDRNLETGGPAGAGLGHPASDAAAERLARLLEGADRGGVSLP